VNVSVRGGQRCEIKGTPQIWRNPRLIYNEARRQWSLLQIRDQLHERGVRPETFEWAAQDVTSLVSQTNYEPIQRALNEGSVVRCVVLRGFADLLNETIQENTHFSKEFSDRVRVIACLSQTPNLVHSDVASETLQGREWKNVRRRMRADSKDALVLVWGNQQDTTTACNEIAIRAREATVGVPNDTRQALKDGTVGFERVLPGAERMYPDTDLPPLAIAQQRLDRLRAGVPAYVWDRAARYHDLKLPLDTIRPLLLSPRAPVFDRVVDELGVDPRFVAVVLVQRWKHWWRKGLPLDRVTDAEIFEVFRAFREGRLSREGVPEVLHMLAELPPAEDESHDRVAAIFVGERIKPLTDTELHQVVREQALTLRGRRFRTPQQRCRFLMGEILEEYVGCVDAKRLLAWVSNRLQTPAGANKSVPVTK
jgi:glutamyl-tRNA(Gln) amidotransferase subunit E